MEFQSSIFVKPESIPVDYSVQEQYQHVQHIMILKIDMSTYHDTEDWHQKLNEHYTAHIFWCKLIIDTELLTDDNISGNPILNMIYKLHQTMRQSPSLLLSQRPVSMHKAMYWNDAVSLQNSAWQIWTCQSQTAIFFISHASWDNCLLLWRFKVLKYRIYHSTKRMYSLSWRPTATGQVQLD